MQLYTLVQWYIRKQMHIAFDKISLRQIQFTIQVVFVLEFLKEIWLQVLRERKSHNHIIVYLSCLFDSIQFVRQYIPLAKFCNRGYTCI